MNPANELRRLGISEEQIARSTVNGKPLAEVVEKKETDRYRSKTERIYAMLLEDDRRAGHIVRWEYEPMKFRLADGAWFTPDFAVWCDKQMELREIKGGFVREAARVRFLVAKRLYPEFGWKMIQKQGAGWETIL